MGPSRAHVVAAALTAVLAGCGRNAAPAGPAAPGSEHEMVGAFVDAVLIGKAAYSDLFDFAAVGQYEKLLHRYDALGRSELDDDTRAAWLRETAEPFSAERERRNLGNFYPILAQRTVGTGQGCEPIAPRSEYARLLGQAFPPLPAEPADNAAFEPLRLEVNALITQGGMFTFRCAGGRGALSLVWTRAPGPRGWVLITMYDDVDDDAIDE